MYNYDRYNAYGWVFQRKSVEVSETIPVRLGNAASSAELNVITLYTKGRFDITFEVEPIAEVRRVLVPGWCPKLSPGASTRILPTNSTIQLTAAEYSEFWCCSANQNGNTLPLATLFELQPSNSQTITTQKLFLVEGTATINGVAVQAPIALDVTTSATIVAQSPCYGLFIEVERTI